MKAQLSLLLGLTAAQGALSHVFERAVCNADNCARAVTGTRSESIGLSSRLADCSSFMEVVVTPATVTQTVTVTAPARKRNAQEDYVIEVRQVTVVPSAVPAYASACYGTSRYSSACSCAGITRLTTTVTAPVVVVTTTAVCGGANLLTDPNNCGTCGNVCPSGSCSNGACSSPTCNGQTCANFGPCGAGGSCVCATTSENSGFCVDGSTPCSGLATCNASTDCPSGEVCAVGTCCGGNVCVGATFCGGSTAKRNTFPPLKRGPGLKRGDPSFGTVGGLPPS